MDGFGAGSHEGLNSQVLLDRLEEQLYLPALLVDLAYGVGSGWAKFQDTDAAGRKRDPDTAAAAVRAGLFVSSPTTLQAAKPDRMRPSERGSRINSNALS